ncbi:MAG: lysine--tRNA ligase [Candidatus Colwellbacteria bacterium]|nr:lysine--tRNA ligase [Candidatus Colwellbacteria bacterium]
MAALNDLIRERRRKLEAIKAKGLDPYPPDSKRTHVIAEVIANFGKLSKRNKKIYLVGRMRALRDQGGLVFLDLEDESSRIQAILNKKSLKDFEFWQENLDIGDFLQVSGLLLKTKRGEKSIEVKNLKLLVKSLRTIPKEFYGIADAETLLRRRYLDLLLHPETREIFVKKSRFWDTVRETMKKNGFLEVETPALEAVPGGADAEPFVTRHHALKTDFYLRISLEIALKKLLIGGYEKVFEIGRIFRNEGISAEHLQDYTQLEFYWAYADYNDLMEFVEGMYKEAIRATCGSLVTAFKGQEINWSKKWPKVDYYTVFKKKVGLDLSRATEKELFNRAMKGGLKPTKAMGRGRLIDLLFKKVRVGMIQPCFLVNPPVEVEPLAKRIPRSPDKVARFQIVACGTELGKGFSEANDPIDQRKRFEEQMKLRRKGDKEAQRLDEDFLGALEYGMPPAAGFGMSERFFAVLMDKPVRETTLFPLMRPEK